MSTPAQPATPQSGVGDVLGKSFQLYFGRFANYLVIPVCVLGPAYIVNAIIKFFVVRAAMRAVLENPFAAVGTALGGSALVGLLTNLIQWAAMGLALGLLAKIAVAQFEGRTMTATEAFQETKPVLGALVVGSVLFGLAMALGLLLLVLPALVVGFFFCLVPHSIVLGNEDAFGAFGRSARTALKVPAELALVLVIAFAYEFLAGLITGAIGLVGAFTVGPFLAMIVGAAFAVVLVPWLAIALALVFQKGKELGA